MLIRLKMRHVWLWAATNREADPEVGQNSVTFGAKGNSHAPLKDHGRYLLPHSKVMIHEPLIPYGVGGKTSSVQTIASDLLKTKEEMIKILSKHTGQTLMKLRNITKNDAFFKGEEAVEFGLADEVIGFDKMMEA